MIEMAHLTIIAMLGSMGNFIVVLSIAVEKRTHKHGNIFIINLAVADLLVSSNYVSSNYIYMIIVYYTESKPKVKQVIKPLLLMIACT